MVPAQWEVVALLLRDLARHNPDFMSLDEGGDRGPGRRGCSAGGRPSASGIPGACRTSRSTGWAGRSWRTSSFSPATPGGLPRDRRPALLPERLVAARQARPAAAEAARPGAGVRAPGRGGDAPAARAAPARAAGVARQLGDTGDRRARPLADAPGRSRSSYVDAGNAGETLFVRVERQTLSRLPGTGAILVTVRTRSRPLDVVARDPERARPSSARRWRSRVAPGRLVPPSMSRTAGSRRRRACGGCGLEDPRCRHRAGRR